MSVATDDVANADERSLGPIAVMEGVRDGFVFRSVATGRRGDEVLVAG